MLRPLLASVALLLIATPGCAQETAWSSVNRSIEAAYPSVPQITTDSLARRLASDAPPPLLLDARTPEEYAVSHLPGAVRVDPEIDAATLRDTIESSRPIVVYCSVGYRSAGVTERLREAGFTDVANLQGSIFAWANEGRPVVRGGAVVRQVHPYDALWGRLLDDELHATEPR